MLSGSLSEILAELKYLNYYLFIVIIIIIIIIIIKDSFIIIIIGIINIYYYLDFYIVPTKQKGKRK